MLDTAVVAAFKIKAGDRGYQTLINEALKQYLSQNLLEDTLRRILREELTHAH
jgi:predicted nucleic acid-binding protein